MGWVKDIQKQIQEIRLREKATEELYKKEAKLAQQQAIINEAMEVHRLLQERRKNKKLTNVWTQQHKVKLRRKALEVQQSLEEDRKLLEHVLQEEEEERQEKEMKKTQARIDMEHMKYILHQQLLLEQQREKDIEFLFQEEAKEMWKKREAEWEKESVARAQLLKDVLAGIQTQIEENIVKTQLEQEEQLQNRQQIIADMEKERIEFKKREEEYKKKISVRKTELEAQILQNKIRREKLEKETLDYNQLK